MGDVFVDDHKEISFVDLEKKRMHIVAATNVKTVRPYSTLYTFAVAVKVVDPSLP